MHQDLHLSSLEDPELTRLQTILDAACERLHIEPTPETRHIREFLGRQLISMRESETVDDATLIGRIADRAQLLGFGKLTSD